MKTSWRFDFVLWTMWLFCATLLALSSIGLFFLAFWIGYTYEILTCWWKMPTQVVIVVVMIILAISSINMFECSAKYKFRKKVYTYDGPPSGPMPP